MLVIVFRLLLDFMCVNLLVDLEDADDLLHVVVKAEVALREIGSVGLGVHDFHLLYQKSFKTALEMV